MSILIILRIASNQKELLVSKSVLLKMCSAAQNNNIANFEFYKTANFEIIKCQLMCLKSKMFDEQ